MCESRRGQYGGREGHGGCGCHGGRGAISKKHFPKKQKFPKKAKINKFLITFSKKTKLFNAIHGLRSILDGLQSLCDLHGLLGLIGLSHSVKINQGQRQVIWPGEPKSDLSR
jgi:hypothetical protein